MPLHCLRRKGPPSGSRHSRENSLRAGVYRRPGIGRRLGTGRRRCQSGYHGPAGRGGHLSVGGHPRAQRPRAGPGNSGRPQQCRYVLRVYLLLRPQHALVSSFLPGMKNFCWGRILAIGSSGVAAPLPNLALSNTVRAAPAGYLKTLAAEVASDDVTVNMLLPGRIATDGPVALTGPQPDGAESRLT